MEAQLLPTTAPFALRELDPSYLPPEINQFFNAFPFAPLGIPRTSVQETIESFLPPMERAIALCETFLEHLSWMFHIVSRRQLIDELIPAIYKQARVTYGPHELAVLLITLGIGALVDLELQPYNLEAQHYYRLARAALSLQSVLTEPSIVTIKVRVFHISFPQFLTRPDLAFNEHLQRFEREGVKYGGVVRVSGYGKPGCVEGIYRFLFQIRTPADLNDRPDCVRDILELSYRLLTKTDIDPSMWRFEGREAYERRIYFWNLLLAVLWQVSYPPPSSFIPIVHMTSPRP